mgnify:CR=1 FL=1
MECIQRGVGGRGIVRNAVLQLIEEDEKALVTCARYGRRYLKTMRPERETRKAVAHGSPMSFRGRGKK